MTRENEAGTWRAALGGVTARGGYVGVARAAGIWSLTAAGLTLLPRKKKKVHVLL